MCRQVGKKEGPAENDLLYRPTSGGLITTAGRILSDLTAFCNPTSRGFSRHEQCSQVENYDDIGNNFCADDGNIFFINMQIQHWSLPPWGTAGYYLTVEFWYRDSPPSNVIYWGGWFYKQYTYPIDCSAIAGESLTKHHPPSPGYYSKCDMDSISCTVTAL